MNNQIKHTNRQLPVLIGNDQTHILAKTEIFRTPEKVLIQITSDGPNGQLLAEFLEQAEPIGISFIPIPVQNIREKRETT